MNILYAAARSRPSLAPLRAVTQYACFQTVWVRAPPRVSLQSFDCNSLTSQDFYLLFS